MDWCAEWGGEGIDAPSITAARARTAQWQMTGANQRIYKQKRAIVMGRCGGSCRRKILVLVAAVVCGQGESRVSICFTLLSHVPSAPLLRALSSYSLSPSSHEL